MCRRSMATTCRRYWRDRKGKGRQSGKPQFIVARTLIGKGIPEVAGTAKAHGEGGAKFIDAARKGLGLPATNTSLSPKKPAATSIAHKQTARRIREWLATYERGGGQSGSRQGTLRWSRAADVPLTCWRRSRPFPPTRKLRLARPAAMSSSRWPRPCRCSSAAARICTAPRSITSIPTRTSRRATATGRNIRFGIREHAMAAMLNGFAYDGIFRPSGATFLVFADYARPSIRLAALSQSAGDLHLHARFRRRRRGWPDASARGNGRRSARHSAARRHPPG